MRRPGPSIIIHDRLLDVALDAAQHGRVDYVDQHPNRIGAVQSHRRRHVPRQAGGDDDDVRRVAQRLYLLDEEVHEPTQRRVLGANEELRARKE